MVTQNLTFAIILALLGGLFQVISVLVLAYPEHLKQTKGRQFKKPMKRVLVPINIFVQLFNGAATTGAAIFGPVAIIMPVSVSSQLLFNILIFGYLKMERFDKDVQVGTFIVVLGAITLPVVGPTVQQNQDIMELLSAPWSLLWTSFLFAGVVISGILCFACVNTKRFDVRSKAVYVTLAVARVFSAVLSASLSKALALVTGYRLAIVICGFLICGLVLGTSVVLQATETEQKLFVPMISVLTQLVNATTGLILWEDWRVVQSWVGYAAIMVQIVVGVYLISSLDFFENTTDPNYGMAQYVMIRQEATRSLALREEGGVDNYTANVSESPKEVNTSTRSLNEQHNTSSVTSVRGLVGGIRSELSRHQQYSRRQTDNLSISDHFTEYDDKFLIKVIKLAENASKRGEDRFVTPPKISVSDLESNSSIPIQEPEDFSDHQH